MIVVIPLLSLCMILGGVYALMLESIRLQNEWVTLWQARLLKQSVDFYGLEVPVVSSCRALHENDVLVIRGDGIQCWVYRCGMDEAIQVQVVEIANSQNMPSP